MPRGRIALLVIVAFGKDSGNPGLADEVVDCLAGT
jgi:hypothetical protein